MANPFRGLSRNVLIFGFVSLLTDASTEMILPILPLFLVSIGAEKAAIGLIEGVAESTSSLLKVFSGWYSDKLERRKGLVASGYGLSAVTKIFFALVVTWPQALAVRFVERVGKGIRTSPRDAIIADSTDPRLMGKAFGFHRAMDTSGAILGSLLAFLLVASFTYQEIFLLSVIPGAIAVV
ncbi:MAG: MFS transporter, partial [Candidatus Hydrothermarchaeota archaeon]